MTEPASISHLDELDGLNATRALILQAYYALRRRFAPRQIGTGEIVKWIGRYEPEETMPSEALIQLTLTRAKVPHRLPGRPRKETSMASLDPPLMLLSQALPPGRQRP
jgi:hypothetical protein